MNSESASTVATRKESVTLTYVRPSDDGEESDDEEQDLVHVQGRALVEVAAAEREQRAEHGRDSVGAVPDGDPERLLGSSVPGGGDDGEQRQARRLKETEQEPGREQALEVGRRGESARRNTPADDNHRHQNAADGEEGRISNHGQERLSRHPVSLRWIRTGEGP